jgi:hypothetical protein
LTFEEDLTVGDLETVLDLTSIKLHVSFQTKGEPGLFGDLEYLRFSQGHIEESFIKLLEALKFIRLQKPGESKTVE